MEEPVSDHGFVHSISIPADSRVPDPATGQATVAEYDNYFRLNREQSSLRSWSFTCLAVQEKILADLTTLDLTADEQRDLVLGFLTLNAVVLRRWIDTTPEAT